MARITIPTTIGLMTNNRTRLLLIVDSDTYQRSYHTMVLQRFEFRVATAASAAEAMGSIAAELPALVIIDVDLPDMSGFDLLGRLRKDKRTAGIPVIALSLNGDNASEARCLQAGFATCLKKPAPAEELYRSVQAALEPTPRKDTRVHKKMPVFVNRVPLDCVEGECASVISEHGMYIRTLKPHPPNSRVDIRIDLEGRSIAAEAVVLYSHRFGEGPFGEPGMGVKFARITPQDQEFLRHYIHSEAVPQ
jgi:CheY-like chemotaxis protein